MLYGVRMRALGTWIEVCIGHLSHLRGDGVLVLAASLAPAEGAGLLPPDVIRSDWFEPSGLDFAMGTQPLSTLQPLESGGCALSAKLLALRICSLLETANPTRGIRAPGAVAAGLPPQNVDTLRLSPFLQTGHRQSRCGPDMMAVIGGALRASSLTLAQTKVALLVFKAVRPPIFRIAQPINPPASRLTT